MTMTTTAFLLLFTLVAVVSLSEGQVATEWNVRTENGRAVFWRWEWDDSTQRWYVRDRDTQTPAPTPSPTPAPEYTWQYDADANKWVKVVMGQQADENEMERELEGATDCSALEYVKENFMQQHGIWQNLADKFMERCLLGKHMMVPKKTLRTWRDLVQGNSRRKKRTTIEFANYAEQQWSNGRISYFFDGDNPHTQSEKSLIRQAMAMWMEKTCMEFVEVSPTSVVPRINITSRATGCISFVGKAEVQPQPLFLSSGQCFEDLAGTTAHELGHVIGIWHEIQRPDRDNHVQVDLAKVNSDETGNFLKLPDLVADTHDSPYDFASIMHYDSFAFVKEQGAGRVLTTRNAAYQNSIGQRVRPSYYDVFKVNQAYCQDKCRGINVLCARGHQNPNSCQTCICPDGFSGGLCNELAPSRPTPGLCGGDLVAGYDRLTLETPGFQQGRYDNNLECVWRIRANPGFKVRASFTGNFGIYQNSKETCFHWAEVKLGTDFTPAGQRFCSSTRPTDQLVSEGNELIVIFKSIYDNTAGASADLTRGFQLQFQTTEERPPSPCANQPCQNGGTCTEDSTAVNGFRCTCLPQWTGLTCLEPAECPADACNSRAERCQITPGRPNNYYCECLTGYQGSNCETDLCDNYCANGGTCNRPSVVLVIEGQPTNSGQPPCTCPPGWTGTRCETPATVQCPANAQCLNGGTCVPSTDRNRFPNGYYCDCMMGFLGDNCGTDICTGRCGNGGTCTRLVIEGTPAPQCDCQPGYSGENCEIEICPPGACSDNGRCIPGNPPGSRNRNAPFYCDCNIGYLANDEQTDCSDPCGVGSNPCQNGGSCVRLGLRSNPARCICPRGYSPPNCEATPCISNPCQNEGICANGPDGYSCICRNRYTGVNCETAPANPCSSGPCENNGICTSNRLTGTFRCTCRNGYSGLRCQTPPNPCSSNPCRNGGICSRSGTGYSCACRSGFQGTNCEVEDTVIPGPVSGQCARGTCGGGNLTAGHHTSNVCPGQIIMKTKVVKTCEWARSRGSFWPSRQCSHREVQEQVQLHTCCNGALNVTALRLEGRHNVPICVMPGWEPDYKPCPDPSLGYCGGCGKQTRSRWGIRVRHGCQVFERIEVLQKQCASQVCQRCSHWEMICGLCTFDGCCEGAERQGNNCVPNESGQPREPSATQVPIVTVDPLEGLLPQRDADGPEVTDARWDWSWEWSP